MASVGLPFFNVSHRITPTCYTGSGSHPVSTEDNTTFIIAKENTHKESGNSWWWTRYVALLSFLFVGWAEH
jgi:hypothetical protein